METYLKTHIQSWQSRYKCSSPFIIVTHLTSFPSSKIQSVILTSWLSKVACNLRCNLDNDIPCILNKIVYQEKTDQYKPSSQVVQPDFHIRILHPQVSSISTIVSLMIEPKLLVENTYVSHSSNKNTFNFCMQVYIYIQIYIFCLIGHIFFLVDIWTEMATHWNTFQQKMKFQVCMNKMSQNELEVNEINIFFTQIVFLFFLPM